MPMPFFLSSIDRLRPTSRLLTLLGCQGGMPATHFIPKGIQDHLEYDREDGHSTLIIAGFPLRRTSALFSQADRKSVVSGKSVSVRVDLGVRRIIKKKKKN